MCAKSGEDELASMSTHTNSGIAMPHMLCRGAWTYSRFKPPSVIHQVRLRAITWLQILWTAVLFGLDSAVSE